MTASCVQCFSCATCLTQTVTYVSPAQIVFGRPLRDALSFVNSLEKFSNPNIRPRWREAWTAKEDALRTWMTCSIESLAEHTRPLRPLAIGDKVFIQNQNGHSPTKWDRSGTVMESIGHNQYCVKVDGTGRLTLHNRRFLRAFTLATPAIDLQPAVPPSRKPMPAMRQAAATPGTVDTTAARLQQHTEEMHAPPVSSTPLAAPASSPLEPPNPSPADDSPMPLQTAPEPRPPSPLRQRSRRAPQPRRIYEPESGQWIELSSSPHSCP